MKFLEKYWAFAFLICNILMNFVKTMSIATSASYVLLALGVLPFISNIRYIFSGQTLKANKFLLGYAILVVLYQCTFGLQYSNDKSLLYVIAKVVTSGAFVVCVSKNFDFYFKKMIPLIAIFVSFLIIIGYFTGRIGSNGRHYLGFANPNDIGGMAAMCFSMVFISFKRSRNKKYDYALIMCCFICLFGVFLTGSRTSFAMVVISLFVKYGLNARTVGLFIGAIIFLVVLNVVGFNVMALDRISDNVQNRDFVDDRSDVREAAMKMIEMRPITGSGLCSTNEGDAADITDMGSHNSYLDLMKDMGIPFAGVLFILLFSNVVYLLKKYFFNYDMLRRSYLYVVLAIPAASMFESYMTGINQLATTYFLICITVLNIDKQLLEV